MSSLGEKVVVRVASPDDAEAVGTLLRASYPALLATHYEAGLLARALPFMIQPVQALLSCGTWYVAEMPDSPGALAGCGGWTLSPPSGRTDTTEPLLGHLRHFATHTAYVRRGIGHSVFARCLADARAAGLRGFECHSTLAAEPFYRALGFARLGPMSALLGGRVEFLGVHMRLLLED